VRLVEARARARFAAAGVACLALALALVPDLASGAPTARGVAAALETDPVYVAPSESGRLSVAARGRVRIRIVQRDIGRIQIAVVPAGSAERAGGLGELANAVDQAMPGRRGSLILTTGTAFHVVTSHGAVNPTTAALRTAISSNRNKDLEAQLLAAVDGIAEVDPGTGADVNAPAPGPPATPPAGTEADDFIDDLGDSFRLGVLIVAAAVALPFLLGAVALLVRWRRRHAAAEERERFDRGGARDELIALGEDIHALDIDVEMPNASARGREDYSRALTLYDRANQLLGTDDPSEVELYEAKRSLEEGRSRIAAARAALGLEGGASAPPLPDRGTPATDL